VAKNPALLPIPESYLGVIVTSKTSHYNGGMPKRITKSIEIDLDSQVLLAFDGTVSL
jgi:hypothetical protein